LDAFRSLKTAKCQTELMVHVIHSCLTSMVIGIYLLGSLDSI